MQIKLPQEDEEDNLFQEKQQSTSTQPKQAQENLEKYKEKIKLSIYIFLAIVFIIAIIIVFKQTVRIQICVLAQPTQGHGLNSNQQLIVKSQENVKKQITGQATKTPLEEKSKEFVIEKSRSSEQLKIVDWEKAESQNVGAQKQPTVVQQTLNKQESEKKQAQSQIQTYLEQGHNKLGQKEQDAQAKTKIIQKNQNNGVKLQEKQKQAKDKDKEKVNQKVEAKSQQNKNTVNNGDTKSLSLNKPQIQKDIKLQKPALDQNKKNQQTKVPTQDVQKKTSNQITPKRSLQNVVNPPIKNKEQDIKKKQEEIKQFKKIQERGMIRPYRSPKFNIPKNIWIFAQPNQLDSFSFYVKKCIENIKYFAKKSQFELSIISSINYMNYVSPQSLKKIQNTISILKTRQQKQPKNNLKDHFSTIKRKLICFHILNQKGGIFVEKNVLFTETFNWINDISQNMYVNKGNGRANPQYIAFFDIDHGSFFQKHNKSNIIYDTEKYMIQFPVIEPYFLAGVAKGQFLTETLIQYVDLLQKPESLSEKLKKHELKMGSLEGKDLYYQVLYISQHIVLQRKQKQINASGNNLNDNNFAIDYYGLFTINERYFPKKLQFTFQNNHQQKIYTNLAKYTLEQLQQTTGPLRYFVCMMFQSHINFRLQKAVKLQSRYYIHPESFISKYVINDKSQPYIITEIQKNIVNKEGKKWEKLPKIIWIYWDSGIENSTLGNKLCVENIKKYANYSKFEVKQINSSNTQRYLGKFLNDKIDNFIKNKKITTYAQTKSDFVRIALIARYGGIYMDASYFSVEFFDWIVNISQYPTQFIFNRYGELPRVLMHFHPHFGQPFEWTYDKEANTKYMWLSAYENNILIAEANQTLFWDWLDEYGRFVTSPYDQTEQLMKTYGVFSDKWTTKDNTYLAAMDSIKNVIGKKQLQLKEKRKDANYKGPKSAAQFYGIWSISGYRGQQKFRAHTNFDNTYYSKPHNSDNPFLWRYPQNYVSGILGYAKHLIKLYGWNIKYLNTVLYESFSEEFQSEVHPISYFSKYMLSGSRKNIKMQGDELILETKTK